MHEDKVTFENEFLQVIYTVAQEHVLLESVYVVKEERNKGYLKRILKGLYNNYKKPIILECNKNLKGMYEHIGCILISTKKESLCKFIYESA